MSDIVDIKAIADELMEAKTKGGEATRPSARNKEFNMVEAYAVGSEITNRLASQGYTPNGRKIGFTNPAVWPRLALDGPIWAYTYDKTVQYFSDNQANLSLAGMAAPKIEPEIVFKLKSGLTAADSKDPLKILQAVEWMALGFEIVDCNYANWHFRAADMVADFGFHAALIIGETHSLANQNLEELAQKLANLKLNLLKNNELVVDGSGKSVMGSPALSLGGLAELLDHQPSEVKLRAGEVVTTGTITDAQFISAGETWQAQPVGLELPPLTITFE